MTTPRVCPQCGKPLPSDGPQGLCPECLLKAALPGQSGLESAATGDYDSSPATAPEAGTHVNYFGDYELLEEMARGGMGIVWKARQTSLKRDVALKMIRAGALAGPDEVERFLREAEAAANLQHPNIVAIHEVGEHGGQHYFTMDYVAGRDLGTLVKDGPLPPHVAARYVKIIAEAIHYAHQRGTLHRDLKPQNVLIDGADQPRITDFGLAKIMKDDSRLTQSGVVMGSPSYMPPEQAAGRHGDIGPASDVYSLGAMLYELLTGRPPFRGTTALATLREVMEAEPAAPRRLKADIPPDLETICLKCLEKSPSARYPTARALAEELERFLKGEPILARPASAVRKAVSWARRHPGILAALAALVMVALLFGVFYLFEENAFLRAQQADPSLARIPGPHHEAVELWSTITVWAICAGWVFRLSFKPWLKSWLGVFFKAVRGRAHGLSFKPWLKQANPRPLLHHCERTRPFIIGAGFIMGGCGVMLLVTAIQAHIWEGESIGKDNTCLIYLSFYSGFAIFREVIRDYRLVHYGIPAQLTAGQTQLTAEQIAPIRRALEDGNLAAAKRHYREAVPHASFMQVNQYVLDLFKSLPPRKLDLPPLSLATLNWKGMAICALIEAFILGVWWYVMRPSHPAWAIFAYAFLSGMGLMVALCVKGRKQMLLGCAAVPALCLIMIIITILGESSPLMAWEADVSGLFFGFFLMNSAIRRSATD